MVLPFLFIRPYLSQATIYCVGENNMKIRRSMLERVFREELKNILAEEALLKEWDVTAAPAPVVPRSPAPEPKEVEYDELTAASDTAAPDWFPTSVAAKAKEQKLQQNQQDQKTVEKAWAGTRDSFIKDMGGANPTHDSVEASAGSRAMINYIQNNVKGVNTREEARDKYINDYHERWTSMFDPDVTPAFTQLMAPAGTKPLSGTAAAHMDPGRFLEKGPEHNPFGGVQHKTPHRAVFSTGTTRGEKRQSLEVTADHEGGHTVGPESVSDLDHIPGSWERGSSPRWDAVKAFNQSIWDAFVPGIAGGAQTKAGAEVLSKKRRAGEGTNSQEAEADIRALRIKLQPGDEFRADHVTDVLAGVVWRRNDDGDIETDEQGVPMLQLGNIRDGQLSGEFQSDEVSAVDDLRSMLINYPMADKNGKTIEKLIKNPDNKGKWIWNPEFIKRSVLLMRTIVKADVPKGKPTPDTSRSYEPMEEPTSMAESKKKGSDMNVLFEGWRNFIVSEKNILAEKALLSEEEPEERPGWTTGRIGDTAKHLGKRAVSGLKGAVSGLTGTEKPEEVEYDTSDITPAGDPDAPDWFPTSVDAKAKEQALQDTESVASEWEVASENAINSYGGREPTRKSIEDGAGSRATINWIQKNLKGGDMTREQAQDLYLNKYHKGWISQIKRYSAHTEADRPMVGGKPIPALGPGELGYNLATGLGQRAIVVAPEKHDPKHPEYDPDEMPTPGELWATIQHEGGHIEPETIALSTNPSDMGAGQRWGAVAQSNKKLGTSVFPDMPLTAGDAEGGETGAVMARTSGTGTQWDEVTADTRSFRVDMPPGEEVVAGDIVDILSGTQREGKPVGGGDLEGTGHNLAKADEVDDIKKGLLHYEMVDENGEKIERTIRNKNGELIWNPKFLERAAETMRTIVKADVPKEKATPSRSYKDTLMKDLQPMAPGAGPTRAKVEESKKKGSDMNVLFEGWRNFIE